MKISELLWFAADNGDTEARNVVLAILSRARLGDLTDSDASTIGRLVADSRTSVDRANDAHIIAGGRRRLGEQLADFDAALEVEKTMGTADDPNCPF